MTKAAGVRVSGAKARLVLVLVSCAALATFGCGLVRTPMSTGPDAEPEPLPDNLCALVGDALLAQLIPAHEPAEHRNSPGSYTSHAYCTVDTDAKKAASTADGSLDLELQRHGSVTKSPRDEAREDLEDACERYGKSPGTYGQLRAVDGMGELACAAVTEDEDRATVRLLVLAGADLVEVTYRARPSTGERTLAGAKAVANNVLARVGR